MICDLQNRLMKCCCMKCLQKYTKIITVEDGTIVGGFGSAILDVHESAQVCCRSKTAWYSG
jgi:deoxyxylulose-5-phosphate synthase